MTNSDVPGAVVAESTPPNQEPSTKRRWLRPVLSGLVSLALVVAIFWYFLPQYTSISAVWSSIKSMTWLEATTLALAAAWNLATYWFVVVSTMPGLKYRQAAVTTEASTAVSNTVPGGGAIGMALTYSMNSSWGFSRNRTSVSLVVSGLWNNFAKLGMPVLALSLLALKGKPGGGRIAAAFIGVLALVAVLMALGMLLSSESSARRIGLWAASAASAVRKPFGRPPVQGWDKATVKFRSRTALLVRARWPFISLATLVSHVSLYLVLLLTLRHLGVSQREVSWIEVLAVFAFARLLTAIPLTPGGLGVVEITLIAGLVAAGGPRPEVAASVLLFRALTFVLPIPIGLGCYLFWKRNKSWRLEPGTAPRTALVPETPLVAGTATT